MLKLVTMAVMAGLQALPAAAQGPDQAAFARAVAEYVELHRAGAAGLPSSAETPEKAQSAQIGLALRIQARRLKAQPGDILGPVAESIRKVVRDALSGADGKAMLATIAEANVQGARLRVNHRYPPGLPRVTMPGPLLAKLPPLPPELEYRFLGRSLVLIDTRANLVVDLLPDVLPVRQR